MRHIDRLVGQLHDEMGREEGEGGLRASGHARTADVTPAILDVLHGWVDCSRRPHPRGQTWRLLETLRQPLVEKVVKHVAVVEPLLLGVIGLVSHLPRLHRLA